MPEGWCWTTIGEVFNLQAGKFISADDIHEESTQYPYRCFGGNGIRGYVSTSNRFGEFPIIGRQGALCGNINFASGEFYATEHAVVVESFGGTVPTWAKYLLEQLNLNQYATATAQPGLSVKTINEVAIPLPPLCEQRRISNTITQYLDIIEDLHDSGEGLQLEIERAKGRILDLAIHGKLVSQDPSDEPAIKLLKRINPDFKPSDNLHYKDCPEGWTIATVADVFEINPKVQGFDEGDAGFVPMTNICDGFSNNFFFEVRKWGKIKNGFTHFADGDIAVAKISPCLENRKSVIMRDLPNGIGAGTTELNIFRSKVVDPEYGLLFFKSDYFIKACAGSYNGVVGQQRVSRHLIEGMLFLLPPISEQKRIIEAVNEYFAVINGITCYLQ